MENVAKDPRPYQLVKGLEGQAFCTAADLLALAGQLWHADGFFFNLKSGEILDQVKGLPVVDEETDQVVGSIPEVAAFYDLVHLGGDPRFVVGRKYRLLEPPVTLAAFQVLKELRQVLYETLNVSGKVVAEEYALLGESMGGKMLSADEVSSILLSQPTG